MKLRHKVLFSLVIGIALLAVAMPVSAQLNVVEKGEYIFIGEQGLDVSAAVAGYTEIAWWDPTSDPSVNPPDLMFEIGSATNFDVDNRFYSTVLHEWGTGNWYGWNDSYTDDVVFKVKEPNAQVTIQDLTAVPTLDVTNGTARMGDLIDFKIGTELWHILAQRGTGSETFHFNLIVTDPYGLERTYLFTVTSSKSLENLNVDTYPWYWSSESDSGSDSNNLWQTDILDEYGHYVYPPGQYRVRIYCNENNLGYSSPTYTVNIIPETLDLTISPATIIRGNTTYATITGIPNRWYFLFIKDCSGKMTGYPCDQPPLIPNMSESWIHFDPYDPLGESDYYIGDQFIECSGCLKTIADITPDYPDSGYRYYALVQMNEAGYRSIPLQTSENTKPGTYIIRAQPFVEETFPALDTTTRYVEKTLTVNMGTVTFQTFVYGEPNSSAYLGETVKISGTNTDSRYTYLFMKGPCQSCVGSDLMAYGAVNCSNPESYTVVPVKPDGTWEYIWETKYLQIDLGEYTIYASSQPATAPSLDGTECNPCTGNECTTCPAWIKHTFTFKQPTINFDIYPKKVFKIVCCDPVDIEIRGSATGIMGDTLENYYDPVPIAIWVFGEDKVAGKKYVYDWTYVNCPGGTFEVNLQNDLRINTLDLQPGVYTVIVQHPMYNHQLDVIPDDILLFWCNYYRDRWELPCYICNLFGLWDCCGTYTYETNRQFVIGSSPVRWSKLFVIDGPDRLKGTAASQALINSFNDPNIDDIIQVRTFTIESNTALQADFSATPRTGPAPLSVQFTDISIGSPATWEWNFGDGYTSNEENPLHVYESPGTYAVTLTITGLSGTSSTTKNGYITVTAGPTYTGTPTPTPTTPPASTMRLYPGWNFVSTPRTLADGHNTVGTVFIGVVDTGGRSIFLYDAASMSWQQMTSGSVIKPLDGIWIYSVGTVDVPLTYKDDPLATPPTKDLPSGWNAIGFSDVTQASAKDTLSSVKNQWTQVIGFNAAAQAYDASLINGGSGSHSDTNPMYPFKGYWLFMNSPGTLAAISA